jgi:hypothetical protein
MRAIMSVHDAKGLETGWRREQWQTTNIIIRGGGDVADSRRIVGRTEPCRLLHHIDAIDRASARTDGRGTLPSLLHSCTAMLYLLSTVSITSTMSPEWMRNMHQTFQFISTTIRHIAAAFSQSRRLSSNRLGRMMTSDA